MRALTILLLLAACGGSSVQHETPPATPPNTSKKQPSYYSMDDAELEQYCLARDAEACQVGGSEAQERKHTPRARDFYWAACGLDHADSCAALSLLENDKIARRALQEKACRLGDGGSCYSLGTASLDDERHKDAYRYLKAACDSGAEIYGELGCKLADKLAENGWGP